jgi:hypothetical protein
MRLRNAIGATALAAALVTTMAGACAQDAAKYPDWSGQWFGKVGGYDPSKPPGRGQQAPLTAEYQAIFEAGLADYQAGGQGNNPTYLCIPPGMPRIMMALQGVGQIDLLVAAPTAFLPLVRAGTIKAFAVTADTRMAVAPDIPTFAEMGLPVLSYSEWAALFSPKGTSADIVGKLNVAAVEPLADPAVRSRLADLGSEFFPRERQTPEALAAMQRADAEKWWPLIKEFGIKAE